MHVRIIRSPYVFLAPGVLLTLLALAAGAPDAARAASDATDAGDAPGLDGAAIAMVDRDVPAPLSPRPGPIGADIAKCSTCHTLDAAFSHPVDFAPARRLPAQFPLDQGRMTCATCHQNATAANHVLARRQGGKMLRAGAVTSANLCVQCHAPPATVSPRNAPPGRALARAAHAASLGRAHLRWGDAATGAAEARRSGTVDRESAICLSCHDGTVAGAVGLGRKDDAASTDHTNAHPVAVAYPKALNRDWAPLGTLNGKVRLFSGQVGCGSCHSPYAPEEKLLVLPTARGRLCASCHQM